MIESRQQVLKVTDAIAALRVFRRHESNIIRERAVQRARYTKYPAQIGGCI